MRKISSIFLAVIFVIMQIPTIGFAFGGSTPNLIITSSNTYSAEAGDSISVTIQVKNTGNEYATNITGSIGNEASGMVYVDGSSYDSIRDLQDGSTGNLSYRIKIDGAAEGRNYSLPLTITYYSEPYNGGLLPGDEGYVIPQKITLSETINIRVKSNITSPQIVVSRVDILPSATVNAGEPIAVGFNLENIGTSIATDIKISLEGLSNEGFAVSPGVNSKNILSLEPGNKQYVYFELKSSKKLAAGNHELKLKITYKDNKGKDVPNEPTNFFITVNSNQGQTSNIIIENLTYPSGSIGQNKEVDINFSIRNQGQIEAKNVIIEATSTDQSGLVPKSISIKKLNTLKQGATEKLNFKFLTTKGSTTKNYPIEITVKYVDDLGKEDTVNQFVGVFIVAPDTTDDGGKKGKPRLIIDKYNFEPQLARAGENFEMTLSFYNTSSNKTVKNIKIFLTAQSGTATDTPGAGGSAFTPVDSSNTFYIDSIPPKGKVEKKITMFTIPDAIAKTHTITANFKYEDSEGNELEDIELIGVPVVQNSRLETGELSYPPQGFVGEQIPISLEFYNTGKVTLYNMMVKLEGDFQTENGSSYIGNFVTGGSEFFEGLVIPSEVGELKGAVLFTYEDSTGQMQELRKEFQFEVTAMTPMDDFPGEFPPNDNGNPGSKSKLWLILLVPIIIIIIVIIILKKRKKKKEKEMSLDE